MELKDKKVNFLGDSITEGHGASDNMHGYVSYFEEKTGALCRNYGVGGTRIARQMQPSRYPEWGEDFCLRAQKMDPDADLVFVFGGTNDFGHGNAPLGTMCDRTPDTFYGALHTLCWQLLQHYTCSTIVFATPLHRPDEDSTLNGEPLCRYVQAIREVAEYYALPVLDWYKNSGLQPSVPYIRQAYLPDGVHPNDAGHERLADQLIAFLQGL